MKFIFVILSVLFAQNKNIVKNTTGDKDYKKWVIEKNSTLNIQGETNINSFQCDVTEYLNPDTLVYINNDATNKLHFINSYLTIDLNQFDCHNRLITGNLRTALKADEYPKLKIIFQNIDQFSNSCKGRAIKGVVDIELANVIKSAEINYQVTVLPGNQIEVKGSHVFSFSDFKLKAPRSVAGLICAKENVRVNFQLFFREI
jgi:hypothetical protein